jgi:hypothetical protein
MTMPANLLTSEHNILPAPVPAANPANPIIISNPAPSQLPADQYFTKEQLEAARQQEKDKLYGKLQKTEEQLKSLLEDKAARDAEVEAARSAAADAAKKEQESRLTAEQLIAAREAEFRKQQEEFKSQMDLQLATMKKEQEFLRLQSYIQRRVNEEIQAANIIPDLVEYISGNTEEEVELSISKAVEKTANIVKGAMTLSSPVSGVSPTGGPSGPLDSLGGTRQPTNEEIAQMSMAEYSKFRVQSGVDRMGNGRGLFS